MHNVGGADAGRQARELSYLCGEPHFRAIAGIVGHGANRQADSKTGRALRAEGRRWAQHVLESPYSWILSTLYIFGTILAGATPLAAVHAAIASGNEDEPAAVAALYLIRIVDAMVYALLPWWTTVAVRLVQGRPWLHRVAGRVVLIADLPYVSQCAEAFLSKLFALSYSATAITVFSANPQDHLTHRHTHRIVRGLLLATGRPDGRLSALAAVESSSLLSIKQAFSIKSLGVTCETLTLGHNPYKLPRARNITLPTKWPEFLSERLLGHHRPIPSLVEGRDMDSSYHMQRAGSAPAADEPTEDLKVPDVIGKLEGRPSPGAMDGYYSWLGSLPRVPGAVLRLIHGREPDGEVAGASLSGVALEPSSPGVHQQMALTPAELLAQQRTLEVLYETRVASLERLVGFFVVFHTMAKAVVGRAVLVARLLPAPRVRLFTDPIEAAGRLDCLARVRGPMGHR